MKNIDYREFNNDILKLYCSIKHSSLESIFIKMSSVEISALHQWLLKQKNIKKSLINTSVYDALIILFKIRSTFPFGETIDRKVLVDILHENAQTLSTIPIILGLSTIMNDTMARDILHPFKDILTHISKQYSPGDGELDSSENLLKDISTIKNSFFGTEIEEKSSVKKRNTISNQKTDMFKYLLSKFTDEIWNAAESNNFKDLAIDIRAGALAKPAPIWLSKFFVLNDQNSFLPISKKVADYVLKNYDMRMSDYNHDIIEMTFMSKSKQVSEEDIKKLKLQHEENKNVFEYLENEEKKYPSIDLSSIINSNKRINPDYLFMLSSMFVFMQNKIGMPSVFRGV